MTEIISELEGIKEENRDELVDILDSYFDPEKEAIVPPSKPNSRRRSFKKGSPKGGRRSRNGGDKSDKKHPTETNNNDVSGTPDSANRSPRRRRFRKRLSVKNLNKSLTETTKVNDTVVAQPIAKSVVPIAPEITVA